MLNNNSVSKSFAFWFLALFTITQIPLYWVEYPDIADFPNHLARLHVLTHLSESETLQRYYELRDFKLGTNLAMETLVPLLAKWMSVNLGLKVFASIATLLLTTGAIALSRVINGRLSYLSLGVFLFCQNAFFIFGLFNYIFGLGLALWLLSAWIFARNRFSFSSCSIFAVGCILIYLCHLSAFGVYAVCVLAYEIGHIRIWGGLTNKNAIRRILFTMTQFIPVILLHIFFSTSQGNYSSESTVFNGSWLETFKNWFVWKTQILIISPSLSISGYILGRSVFGFFLVFSLYIGFREQLLRLATPVKSMSIALLLCIIMLPKQGFGSAVVDVRLIPALGLILWSGLSVINPCKLTTKTILSIIAIAVFLINLDTLREWSFRNIEYQLVRNSLLQIPEGSKVATIVVNKPLNPMPISPHIAAWSVIDRSTLLSNFYLWPFQPVWVAYRKTYTSVAKLARLDGPVKSAPTSYENIKNYYDYILIYGGTEAERKNYASNAKTILSSPSLRLVKTKIDCYEINCN